MKTVLRNMNYNTIDVNFNYEEGEEKRIYERV